MDYMQLAKEIVNTAVKAGADEAEVFLQAGRTLNIEVRMGEVETVSQASEKGFGLRVFTDKRMAFAGSTDFDKKVIEDIAKSAVQLSRKAGRDAYNGLPDVKKSALPQTCLFDCEVESLSAEKIIKLAKECEKAAFACDKRITNSFGAGFDTHITTTCIANTNGIASTYSSTRCGIVCAPMAEANGEKQTAWYMSAKRFLSDLETPEEVGRKAAEFTVRKLGGRKIKTCRAPIVFSWTIAGTILDAVFDAVDGEAAHRGMSFLKNKLGKKIASPNVTIIEDPMMDRGIGSAPFDGEGIPVSRKTIVDKGVLKLYLYDSRTARKYGEHPSGNTKRGFSSTPHLAPFNLYLKPTQTDPTDIIKGIENGFYVTELIGQGANTVTGDFSVGASGIWIQNGELAFPVQEVTIAGNLLDILGGIERVANDPHFISNVVSPTFKVSEMTISGE